MAVEHRKWLVSVFLVKESTVTGQSMRYFLVSDSEAVVAEWVA